MKTRTYAQKFALTAETKNVFGTIVHRIVAIKQFEVMTPAGVMLVKEGQKGGFVEGKRNLSARGSCWIGDDAIVMGRDARVQGDAYVGGRAVVMGAAQVRDKAMVDGSAMLNHNAIVAESSYVGGLAWIGGDAKVFGQAQVRGETLIKGKAVVAGLAKIDGKSNVACSAVVTDGSYSNVKLTGKIAMVTNVTVEGKPYAPVWFCRNVVPTRSGLQIRNRRAKVLKFNGRNSETQRLTTAIA